jgi:hypothetical protein
MLSNITGMTPVTKLDISSWKIPKNIKLANEQFHQPGGIDLLIGADLFYEMSRPGRRTRPGNFPILQETVLGWTLAGRTPAIINPDNAQHRFLLREDSRLEHNLNRFWEVEPVEQSTMTAEQKACEERFLTHTQPNNQMGDLWLNYQPRWNPLNLEHLAPLQSEDYMQLNTDWNEVQTSRFSTTTS